MSNGAVIGWSFVILAACIAGVVWIKRALDKRDAQEQDPYW